MLNKIVNKYTFICICFALLKTNGQPIDVRFCNINTIPSRPLPLPTPQINLNKYEARVERTKIKNGGVITEEYHEFFDSDNNMGMARMQMNGIQLTTYSYYDSNELLIIKGNNKCQVNKLNESYKLSPFLLTTDSDGKLKIVSQLQYLLQSSPLVSTLDSFIRGIPVNQWQTCLYSIEKVSRVTIAFSDKTRWNPAGNTPPASSSIPVSITIESKTGSGAIRTDSYSITDFRPFIADGEEIFNTPSGLFCEGRKNLMPFPTLPEKFEFNAEYVTPYFMDLVGLIASVREKYDYNEKLFESDQSVSNSLVKELEDFNTGICFSKSVLVTRWANVSVKIKGLKYRLDEKSGNCTISKIDSPSTCSVFEPNGKVRIRNPKEFFNFDSDNYHFTGQRVQNGVNTDVWIVKKKLTPDFYVNYEWYFLNKNWIDADFMSDQNVQVPIYAAVNLFNNNSTNPNSTHLYTFSDFQFKNLLLNDNDIVSRCGEGVAKQPIHFSLACFGVDQSVIRSNWVKFNNLVLREIQNRAKVTLLRIVNLEIMFLVNDDAGNIGVLFELFEKSCFYGNVDFPSDFQDDPLADAINNLRYALQNGMFSFNFTISDNDEQAYCVGLKAPTTTTSTTTNTTITTTSSTSRSSTITTPVTSLTSAASTSATIATNQPDTTETAVSTPNVASSASSIITNQPGTITSPNIDSESSPFENNTVIIAIVCSAVGAIVFTLFGVFVVKKIKSSRYSNATVKMSGIMNSNYDED